MTRRTKPGPEARVCFLLSHGWSRPMLKFFLSFGPTYTPSCWRVYVDECWFWDVRSFQKSSGFFGPKHHNHLHTITFFHHCQPSFGAPVSVRLKDTRHAVSCSRSSRSWIPPSWTASSWKLIAITGQCSCPTKRRPAPLGSTATWASQHHQKALGGEHPKQSGSGWSIFGCLSEVFLGFWPAISRFSPGESCLWHFDVSPIPSGVR